MALVCGALGVLCLPAASRAENTTAIQPQRYALSILPLLLGDTDRGVIFGAAAAVARTGQAGSPYAWRILLLVQASIRRQADDTLQFPFHEDLLRVELPALLHPRLGLDIELGYRRYASSGYYGLGNASPNDGVGIDHWNEYSHTHPGVSIGLKWRFPPRVDLLLGLRLSYNWIALYPNSQLLADSKSDDPTRRELLVGLDNHLQAALGFGWRYDSRDHPQWPQQGFVHEISWRLSPGIAYLYGGINLDSRAYHSLWRGDRLVLAGRLTTDILIGDAPLYELARIGGLHAQELMGGGAGIRGVPLQRYHGKVKLLGNVELRSRFANLAIGAERFALGVLLFVDAGRVWSRLAPSTAFDGSGLGLKLGAGAGLRVAWGHSMLFRCDLAWSPDARPIGFYAGLNHVF